VSSTVNRYGVTDDTAVVQRRRDAAARQQAAIRAAEARDVQDARDRQRQLRAAFTDRDAQRRASR
jgi:hypothetical protein